VAVIGGIRRRRPHSGERANRVVTSCLVGVRGPVIGGNGKKGTGQADLWPGLQFRIFLNFQKKNFPNLNSNSLPFRVPKKFKLCKMLGLNMLNNFLHWTNFKFAM
jgi:hypothetical protein